MGDLVLEMGALNWTYTSASAAPIMNSAANPEMPTVSRRHVLRVFNTTSCSWREEGVGRRVVKLYFKPAADDQQHVIVEPNRAGPDALILIPMVRTKVIISFTEAFRFEGSAVRVPSLYPDLPFDTLRGSLEP